MIIDFLKSLFENIKQKVKNPFTERNATPFGGAYLIALVLYNWKIFYSLFYFEASESRLSRIEIIEKYLNAECWFARIGYPILIAFASIVTFYFLSNLSLGVSTFFNRWWKAIILYFTDRSKIVTKFELEEIVKREDKLRNSFDDLKKKYANAQTEIEKEKANSIERDTKYIQLNATYERVLHEYEENRQKLQILEENERNFTITYARYGTEKKGIEVTKKIQDIINKSLKSLKLDNKFDTNNILNFIDYIHNLRYSYGSI